MRKPHTLVRSTVTSDVTIYKETYASLTGGSKNIGGRDYPTMEGKMLNSSYVTVILHRRAMHFWIYWGYRGVA
jgi:hypothetical protein